MSATQEHDVTQEGGHRDTPEQRDRKELSALVLFIAGDAIFLILEILAWFYLRALDTQNGWRFSKATPANPATSGSNNPHTIVHEVAKVAPGWTIVIAALALIAGLAAWWAEGNARKGVAHAPILAAALVVALAGIGAQVYQFQILPFSTTDGTYASMFEFFMGSVLAHLFLVVVVLLGVWNRARKGMYNEVWYQIRLARVWTLWVAISGIFLAVTAIFFA